MGSSLRPNTVLHSGITAALSLTSSRPLLQGQRLLPGPLSKHTPSLGLSLCPGPDLFPFVIFVYFLVHVFHLHPPLARELDEDGTLFTA